ncbi:MAG: alpha-L-glutamate ligase, partial [Betaproteobacteria bacterium]|nr:alpha-L-glutamate ligase [Betaproteobacteria bacterium]
MVLFSDDPGWHGARLRRAFASHGCHLRTVSLRDCRVDLSHPAGLRIPGFGQGLPDGAFVRGVPGGSLEQVVLCLDVLHGLQALGIPVYNRARAIEVSVDKAMTSLLLHAAGVATPPTWAVQSPVQARRILLEQTARGHQLVLKPLFGSQGVGLRRL